MMRLVDSHAHLDGLDNGAPAAVESALARARAAGVVRVVGVGGAPEGNRIAAQAARQWPETVRAAVGFDRYNAERAGLDEGELNAQLDGPGVVAVGEAGLDFHHDPKTAEPQIALFTRMLDLAAERRLPIVVHCRESEEAMGPILETHAARWKGDPLRIGVIHCFTGTPAFARRAMACGFHVSFSGILTFPRADNVRTAAAAVPEDRLLVETDTPYLAPPPHRGKTNEPQWVECVLRELARVKGAEPEHLAAVTTANAWRLFNLD
jgi:TatD DNase family protein